MFEHDTFPLFLEYPRLFTSSTDTVKESKCIIQPTSHISVPDESRMHVVNSIFTSNQPAYRNGPSKLQQLRPVYCSGDHYVNCMSPWFTPILLLFLSFKRSCLTVLHDRFSAGSPNLQLFLRWIIITSQYH